MGVMRALRYLGVMLAKDGKCKAKCKSRLT